MSITLAAAPAAAAAQAPADSSEHRDPPPEAVPRVWIGGGVDASGRGIDTPYPPQLALHVGYQLAGGQRVGGPRAGLRVGLDFTASNTGLTSSRLSYPVQTRRSRGLGVVLLGTYALARGPVRPYLVGGVGVYDLRSTGTYQSSSYTDRVDQRAVGVSGGLGLSAAVGRVVLFGEARGTLLPTAALSDAPGLRGVQAPLVLGVRF